MTEEGFEARNLKYYDVCPVTTEAVEQKKHEITIAYNNDYWGNFLVFNDTNTMKEFALWWTLEPARQHPIVSRDWEILTFFFNNNNLEPIWINCNYVWGWFDEDEGKWTGGVGKV